MRDVPNIQYFSTLLGSCEYDIYIFSVLYYRNWNKMKTLYDQTILTFYRICLHCNYSRFSISIKITWKGVLSEDISVNPTMSLKYTVTHLKASGSTDRPSLNLSATDLCNIRYINWWIDIKYFSVSTLFRLDFGTVLTVWYFF